MTTKLTAAWEAHQPWTRDRYLAMLAVPVRQLLEAMYASKGGEETMAARAAFIDACHKIPNEIGADMAQRLEGEPK